MPICYKIDVLAALKQKGYTTTQLRKERLIPEGTIQALREGRFISMNTLSKLCDLLDCQPGDILMREE